jgi:hypothetical protein
VSIQDSVVVVYWLSHLQPETHCPLVLPRGIFFQIAADIHVDVHARLRDIRWTWEHRVPSHHPTKRAMAAAGIDYMFTGYAILSLCMPAQCVFRGRTPATERLVGMYRRARRLPPSTVPIDVDHGLFLGGIVTSDTLTGARGLLNHIYQNHGPAEGLGFVNRLQRLTTSVSLYVRAWVAGHTRVRPRLLSVRGSGVAGAPTAMRRRPLPPG